MAQAVAANEVDDEEHEQGGAYQDGDGDLQAQLQVTKIRNPSHHVRAETAEQLRCEHVDTNGSGMSAARHHVVKNGSDGAMIPGHEKTGDRKSDQHGGFFFCLYGQQEKSTVLIGLAIAGF